MSLPYFSAMFLCSMDFDRRNGGDLDRRTVGTGGDFVGKESICRDMPLACRMVQCVDNRMVTLNMPEGGCSCI